MATKCEGFTVSDSE